MSFCGEPWRRKTWMAGTSPAKWIFWFRDLKTCPSGQLYPQTAPGFDNAKRKLSATFRQHQARAYHKSGATFRGRESETGNRGTQPLYSCIESRDGYYAFVNRRNSISRKRSIWRMKPTS